MTADVPPASSARLGGAIAPSAPGEARQITFLETLNVLLRSRGLILLSALIVPTILCLGALLARRTYTATASFVAQSGKGMGSMSGLAAQLGVNLPTGGEAESPQFYVDLLRSRAILRSLVDRKYTAVQEGRTVTATLADLYDIREKNPGRRREQTIKRLGRDIGASLATKTGIVTVGVTMPLPTLAKAVTDSLIAELNVFNLGRRRTQATAERLFFAGRVQEVKDSLSLAEDRLANFRAGNRDFRGSMRLSLVEEQLQREVGIRQTLYSSVLQMYEQAKLDEVRDTPVITVLESPEVPVDPDPRGLIARGILGLVVGTIIGVVLAFGRAGLRRAAADNPFDLTEYERLKKQMLHDLLFPWRPAVRAVQGRRRKGVET
jgi:uncharacterized protein involved in exopolysaccharide biosynthesis